MNQVINGKIFGYFDHSFVINLERDTRRMELTARHLARLGIPFERFPAIEALRNNADPKANLRAAAFSHRAVIELALKRGYERFLILEDDAILRDDVSAWMEKLTPSLACSSWDMFYLGMFLVRGEPLVQHLSLVIAGGHAHAYAATREGAAKVIDSITRYFEAPGYQHEDFDWDWFRNAPSLRRLCANPLLAIQRPNFSRNTYVFVDRSTEYFCSASEWRDFRNHCVEARGVIWKAYRAVHLFYSAKSTMRRKLRQVIGIALRSLRRIISI
jgi:GR25 family glycosyltransferase involved in LPS biosynthesis